ncbi:Zinc finger FYVE domain-containing protein 1 [Halotydeus destructor]|nr:Zinc finger FYVE domain-containing protein 1 [Halotydeus destructor]
MNSATGSKSTRSQNKNSSKASKILKATTTRPSRRVCQERLACKGNKPEAHYRCDECSTFQCEVCEELLHENQRFIFHDRQPLEHVPIELTCQGDCEDRNYVDVECSDCSRRLCNACDQVAHAQGSRKKHTRQPVVVEATAASVNQPSPGINKENNDNSIDEFLSRDPIIADCNLNRTRIIGDEQDENELCASDDSDELKANVMPQNIESYQQLPDIAQMSLEHLTEDLLGDIMEEKAVKNKSRKKQKQPDRQLDNSSDNGNSFQNRTFESFLLVDEFEMMQVSTSEEFASKLGCNPNASVKVVSIFGNTGEGKSHTLNAAFFDGEEMFKTSPAQSSCTIGIWTAYDAKRKVITIDTEGLLGVSENNNRRTRLLLKVLAVSDVIIYRTRAERLHNDLFTFLGDASRAYVHHFSTELKAAAQRCHFDGPISVLGPVVVVFHETLHTDILKTEHDLTPEDVLRKRFQTLGLSTEAYSAFHYVGTQTSKAPTCFKGLKEAMCRHLENSTVRSARTSSVIYAALSVLNEKFSGDIERTVNSTFPDEYFTCSAQCLSCGSRCSHSMNHHRDGVAHKSSAKCIYQHQFSNKLYFCRHCYDRGDEIQVIPKTSASNESTWFGLANYAMSGYVLECNRCGVIYRSRQYWYGNQEPWDCVHQEVRHIWEGENLCQGSQNAAQKMLDSVSYISETVSGMSAKPASIVKGWVADQIAPPYWVPNHKITCCGLCERDFDPAEKKHHCRKCGYGFCDDCSGHRCPVPDRGWGNQPVRVCDRCYDKIQEAEALRSSGEPEVVARKMGEKFQQTVGTVVCTAIDYPLALVKDYARPEYWKPDHEISKCCVCEQEFTEKNPIHHCRGCGDGVCHPCSLGKKPVKSRGWDMPVRVCDTCDKKPSL